MNDSYQDTQQIKKKAGVSILTLKLYSECNPTVK